LVVDAEATDGIAEALGVQTVDEEAAECLRIERGRPRLGFDMDENTIPQEADLNDRAVSFTKGCYVGQETVARLFYKGKPNRHLRGLRLTEPAERGDPIEIGGKQVGTVGSTCVSPTFGPIALALVRREAAPGDEVSVGAAGAPARVIEPPFQRG
jgi:folate-binding protein YgfZ